MLKKISNKEFQESGLLWFLNTILHVFGMAICWEYSEKDNIDQLYIAKTNYRGFSEDDNSDGYKKVSKYLEYNIPELLNAFKDDE